MLCQRGKEPIATWLTKEFSISFELAYPQLAMNNRAFSIQLTRKFSPRSQKDYNSFLEPPTIVYHIYHVGPGDCSIVSNAPHTLYAS